MGVASRSDNDGDLDLVLEDPVIELPAWISSQQLASGLCSSHRIINRCKTCLGVASRSGKEGGRLLFLRDR